LIANRSSCISLRALFSSAACMILLLENENVSLVDAHRSFRYLMFRINRTCDIYDLMDTSLLWTFISLYLYCSTISIMCQRENNTMRFHVQGTVY